MNRGSHQTHIGVRHYWYAAKDLDHAHIFPHSRVHPQYYREDGFPQEGVNVVSVKETRTVELIGYGVKE